MFKQLKLPPQEYFAQMRRLGLQTPQHLPRLERELQARAGPPKHLSPAGRIDGSVWCPDGTDFWSYVQAHAAKSMPYATYAKCAELAGSPVFSLDTYSTMVTWFEALAIVSGWMRGEIVLSDRELAIVRDDLSYLTLSEFTPSEFASL